MATRTWVIDRDASTLEPTYGNTVDQHHPVGLSTLGSGVFRAFMKFTLDKTDMVTITSAILWMRSTTESHTAFGTSPTIRVKKLTSTLNNTAGGSAENVWSGSASPAADTEPSSTTTDQSAATNMTETDSTWDTVDITDMAQAWLAGGTHYGVLVKAESEATTADAWEFYSKDSAYDPYVVVTYTTNVLPDAPTLTAPSSGSRQTTATPTLGFTHNDDDGDALASYDLQVGTSATLATASHWDAVNQTLGTFGDTVLRVYAGSALTRGTTYYWRARTNDGTGDGTWSAIRSFVYNALPTVTKNAPATSGFAVIHNLGTDLAVWAASEAKPRFKFTPSDANGDSLTKYRIRIYNNSAGTEGDATQVYDSGEVSLTMTSGVLQTISASFGIANGTERWWTVKVYDGYEWGTESTRTAFKMRWAQGVFEFDSGVGSVNWTMTTGVIVETASLLFSSSTGAARTGTVGAWATAIASVTPRRYVQVLVRLTTDTPGTQGSLADMAFSYYGTPSQPDGWTAS